MQYASQSSQRDSRQAQSNVYGASRYYSNGAYHNYAPRFSTPQSGNSNSPYGTYNALSTIPNTQPTTYGSSSGSYDSPPASKRARLDEGHTNDTPTRTNGSWVPMTGNQPHYEAQQYSGLALPPMPQLPRPVADPSPPILANGRNHDPQLSQSMQVPSHLEQQVRRLVEYDLENPPEYATGTPTHGQLQVHATSESAAGRADGNSAQYQMPERGAKDGKMLNLACVECMRRRRKCSKDFPCNDCQKYDVQCVPSVRKHRSSAISGTDHIPEQQDEATPDVDGRPVSTKKVARDHDDPNRRYFFTLPPVVNGFQEWSNMRLKYTPFPDDVDPVREMYFNMEKPVLINSQQFADYWPHISNMYSRGVGPSMQANGTQVEKWECRNQRRQTRHKRITEPAGQGLQRKRERKHHLLEGTETCKLRFRLVAYIKHADTDEEHNKGIGRCNCVPEWLYMEKTTLTEHHSHSHTLESLDKYKRTDALLFFAEQKVMEGGYMYNSVCRWIKEKYGHITKQVEHLTPHDVANAAKRWRSQNRDIELIESIPEPSPEDERREKCLKLMHTTTLDGLRNALREVCARLPEAVEIALPLLESSQLPETETAEEKSKILQGDEIEVPEPGLPWQWLQARKPTGPMEIIPDNSTDLRFRNIHGGGLPEQPEQTTNQSVSAERLPQYPNVDQQRLLDQQRLPQSHLPRLQPMSPPSQVPDPIRFLVYQPRINTPPLPPPPSNGAYSGISSGHRLHVPTTGSNMAIQAQDTRPSWAQPDQLASTKGKGKEVEETDEMKVQRQLEAELQA